MAVLISDNKKNVGISPAFYLLFTPNNLMIELFVTLVIIAAAAAWLALRLSRPKPLTQKEKDQSRPETIYENDSVVQMNKPNPTIKIIK